MKVLPFLANVKGLNLTHNITCIRHSSSASAAGGAALPEILRKIKIHISIKVSFRRYAHPLTNI
jgi:hypothetical protein